MKISHRLIALTCFTSAGLIAVAAVSYGAVTSIQAKLRSLTLQATPLQNRTYELQERSERAMGTLLRLSLAQSADDAQRGQAAFDNEMQALDRLASDIGKLDPNTHTDLSAFRVARSQIAVAVEQRLRDGVAYQSQTESARNALGHAEQAIASTRAAVAAIEADAAKAADAAQDSSRSLAAGTKAALQAQGQLKDMTLLLAETELVTNRFRLTPLKERLKASIEALNRIDDDAKQATRLKDIKATASAANDGFNKDGSGLFALRAEVLGGKKEQEAAYQAQRLALRKLFEQEVSRLGAVVDALEVQALQQRQLLEAALRFRSEPGGVVGASDAISLDMKETTALLRLLMLAASPAETQASEAALVALSQRMTSNVGRLRIGLTKLGKPQLLANVEAAARALKSVDGSVALVAQAKRSVLDTEVALTKALAELKDVATQQASLGATQVQGIAERQRQVVEQVDGQVAASLALILGISSAIIGAAALASVLTLRVITRRLDSAVAVAEAVSQGRLNALPESAQMSRGNDETTRLLSAMAAMVRTLTGMVRQIRDAGQSIHGGSTDIAQSNHELSGHTEQQASRLRQTVLAMGELTLTLKQTSQAAVQVEALASQANRAAVQGGDAVGRVVTTMDEIQSSSKRIAEIVGVIDGIAFQTNILALNAAVEAARAGEHGRGFAVVASEVRALAGKSADAARQVKAIITASVTRVQGGTTLVLDAGQTIASVVAQVHQVNSLIETISAASQTQFASLEAINQAVLQIDTMTQRNSALAEQGTAATTQLCQQAEGLMAAVSVFKLEPA